MFNQETGNKNKVHLEKQTQTGWPHKENGIIL